MHFICHVDKLNIQVKSNIFYSPISYITSTCGECRRISRSFGGTLPGMGKQSAASCATPASPSQAAQVVCTATWRASTRRKDMRPVAVKLQLSNFRWRRFRIAQEASQRQRGGDYAGHSRYDNFGLCATKHCGSWRISEVVGYCVSRLQDTMQKYCAHAYREALRRGEGDPAIQSWICLDNVVDDYDYWIIYALIWYHLMQFY